MIIKMDIYQKILNSFPAVPPEGGCILGSREDVVCSFEYDSGFPRLDMAVYMPNIDVLNQVIQQWASEDIQFYGLAHSHPYGQRSLSSSDITYIHTIMQAMPTSIEKLYFPLVFPGEEIISFVAIRYQSRIDILPDDIKIKLKRRPNHGRHQEQEEKGGEGQTSLRCFLRPQLRRRMHLLESP